MENTLPSTSQKAMPMPKPNLEKLIISKHSIDRFIQAYNGKYSNLTDGEVIEEIRKRLDKGCSFVNGNRNTGQKTFVDKQGEYLYFIQNNHLKTVLSVDRVDANKLPFNISIER